MIEYLEKLYNLEIATFIKSHNKTYKIVSTNGEYILKYVDDAKQENIFSRLYMLNDQIFLIPIKSINNRFIERYKELYFIVTPFIKDESQINKDIRLHFYVKSIASLHKLSDYGVNVSDGFFDESLNYLEKNIYKYKNELQARIERVERQDFYSPSDWYFLMNYNLLMNALKESARRIESLDEEWNKKESINLSLTYQNFDYEHINVKYQKIISLDKMVIAPCIYDLINIFNEAYISRIDIKKLFKEYMGIHPLEQYEIDWLLAFLFIPEYKTNVNIKDDIDYQFTLLSRLHSIENLATYLNSFNSD